MEHGGSADTSDNCPDMPILSRSKAGHSASNIKAVTATEKDNLVGEKREGGEMIEERKK